MRNRIWMLCGGLMLALAAAALADSTSPPPKDPPDPPGTKPYMDLLRAQFAAWDLNSDNFLDKTELAKAFRGADAKPYDYTATTDKPAPDKPALPALGASTAGLLSSPLGQGPLLAASALIHGRADKPAPDKPADSSSTKKPDYSEYPDYNFLMQLDQDGDGQISRTEFMNWARGYAVQLKQLSDQEAKVLALQAKIQAATSKKEVQALEKELAKEQAAANKANSQMTKEMKTLEKAIQQPPKPK